MNAIIRSVGMSFTIVVLVAAATAVLEIGIINVSHAQVTPSQNPMCDPTDRFINTTESHVCGVPKTPLATPAGPTTTEPPSSITPPSVSGTPEAPIPRLP